MQVLAFYCMYHFSPVGFIECPLVLALRNEVSGSLLFPDRFLGEILQ